MGRHSFPFPQPRTTQTTQDVYTQTAQTAQDLHTQTVQRQDVHTQTTHTPTTPAQNLHTQTTQTTPTLPGLLHPDRVGGSSFDARASSRPARGSSNRRLKYDEPIHIFVVENGVDDPPWNEPPALGAGGRPPRPLRDPPVPGPRPHSRGGGLLVWPIWEGHRLVSC